jgi:DNA-binding MarR family transcriptional regulator
MKCDPHSLSEFSSPGDYADETEGASTESLYPRLAQITQTVSRVQTAILVRLGLNHSRWAILKFLDESGESLRCSDLADLVCVSRATITGVLDTLEKSGLIVRVPDPHDRRAFSVKITLRGEEILREVRSELERWTAQVQGEISGTDIEQLTRLLDRLGDILDQQSAEILDAGRGSLPI